MRLAEQYSKNVSAIISEVRLSRGRFFVLVEGKSDYRFLRSHVGSGVSVVAVEGRDAVVNATRILGGFRKDNFVGVVDADLLCVVERAEDLPRLVHVSLDDDEQESCIDLEACLLRTAALEKVCLEAFGDRVERSGGVEEVARRIRGWLRETAAAIGSYRAAVMEHGRSGDRVASLANFSDCWSTEWQRFVDARAMACDESALEKVMQEHITPREKFSVVRQTAADFASRCRTGWLLCRGHDMSRLLAMHFNANGVSMGGPADIERALRMSFDRQMLERTAFGRKLLAFLSYPPYAVGTPRSVR
jgi:hypothetical protein